MGWLGLLVSRLALSQLSPPLETQEQMQAATVQVRYLREIASKFSEVVRYLIDRETQ